MTEIDPRQLEQARAFKAMHEAGGLLLPNAWDPMSARVFARAGFAAVGTTSGGIAWARGFADGERIGRERMLAEVARIVAVAGVPVSADLEAGYGSEPEDVALTVRGAIAAGAVGVNLEDGTGSSATPLFDPPTQAARLRAAREEASRIGIPLVLNARIDTYLVGAGAGATEPKALFAETCRRAAAYLAAGADAIFVPGVVDPETVAALVRAIPAPLNVMASPGAPPAADLFALGVVRVSIGGAAALAALGLIKEIARELREAGTYGAIGRTAAGFAEAQSLFAEIGRAHV